MSVEFCDTNVIVYAYDVTAGTRREFARQLLDRLWTDGVGAASVQVHLAKHRPARDQLMWRPLVASS